VALVIELPNLVDPETMGRFILGCFIGAGVVWSSVVRTLAVKDASMREGIIGSLANSISYYFSIHFVVRDDIVGYLGTCVGSTFIILTMVANAKRGRREWEKRKKSKYTTLNKDNSKN
jgi:hypothetical protein